MSGLFSSLQGVSNALSVYSQALAAEQNNVSNSSTPGYAAVRAVIQPLNGGTADTVILRSTASAQADAIVNAATSQAADSQTQAQQLAEVNAQFDITGSTGILAAFQQFSGAFSKLSVTPSDPSLRSAALGAAGSVALAFNAAASALTSQSQRMQAGVQSTVSQINALASQIARENVQLRGASSPDTGAETAQRNALTELSSLVGITVNQNADGTVNVLAGGSIPLVLGDHAETLSANTAAAPGSQIISSGGGAAPASFSGVLGGLLDTLNNTIASVLGGNGQTGSLNTLALSFATTVNSLATSGVTAGGASGIPVFTYDASKPSGTAHSLAVNPALTQDLLAVATTGANAQSNGLATQFAALASSSVPANQISGQSPQDYFASIAQTVGRQLNAATAQSAADQTTLTDAQAGQTAAEGVSLDQEAVYITGYQRAWQASAKLVSVVDNLLLDAVNLVGPQDA